MKEKITATWRREELAAYLEELAGRLRHGTLTLKGRDWGLPERLEVKIRGHRKKGRLETRLAWRCSIPDEEGRPAAGPEIKERRRAMKAVKKRMAKAFAKVVRAAEAGRIPSGQPLGDLAETSRLFAAAPDAPWRAAMDEYLAHLAALTRAAGEGNLEAVRHEVRELRRRKQACHKEFK